MVYIEEYSLLNNNVPTRPPRGNLVDGQPRDHKLLKVVWNISKTIDSVPKTIPWEAKHTQDRQTTTHCLFLVLQLHERRRHYYYMIAMVAVIIIIGGAIANATIITITTSTTCITIISLVTIATNIIIVILKKCHNYPDDNS